MNWINLEIRVLDNEAFACAETAAIGTWLRLMRYCCSQENGGRIRNAKSFDDRKVSMIFRLSRAEIAKESDLWEWKGEDLIVRYFPLAKQQEVKGKRASAAHASKVRWGKRAAQPHPTSEPISHATPQPRTDATSVSVREGKEKRKEKGKKKEGSAPVGTEAIPRDLAEVITFFASLNASRVLAEKFFHHYQANGWRQGGGLPLASWRSQGEKWIVDSRSAPTSSKNIEAQGPAPEAFN